MTSVVAAEAETANARRLRAGGAIQKQSLQGSILFAFEPEPSWINEKMGGIGSDGSVTCRNYILENLVVGTNVRRRRHEANLRVVATVDAREMRREAPCMVPLRHACRGRRIGSGHENRKKVERDGLPKCVTLINFDN